MKYLSRLLIILSLAAFPGPAGAGETLSPSLAPADNTAALNLFRQGRYRAAYAAFWPALERGDPEAVFHGLIIRRHGLDGRLPAQAAETAALTGLLAGRAAFMRQALAEPGLPETAADAYRSALAQMIYFGQLPLERPPASPAEAPARRRDEALKLIFNLFRSAPGDRYPPALNFAAYLYLAPEGPRQPAKARALLRKSAEAGDRLGMLNLARLYREGLGGPRDNLKAAHWARRAADAEPPPARALNEVGYFYETGRGVTRDLAEAKAWYEKSAGRGYAPGRTNAARLKGQGRDRPALDEDILF